MAYSKILIVFDSATNIGDQVRFRWRDLDTPSQDVLTQEVSNTSRFGAGQFISTGVSGGDAATYRQAWELDYNSTNLFDVEIVSGYQVQITAKKSNIEFLDTFTDAPDVNFFITNEAQVPEFAIVSQVFREASTNKCTNVEVEVTTTNPMQDVTSPISLPAHNNSVVTFDYVRGNNVLFEANDSNGQSVSLTLVMPKFLNEPTVAIVNTPSGANATISLQTDLSGITYSLDDINYQNSSVFPGLVVASYTAYVKDTYGCTKSTAFEVTEFDAGVGVTDPEVFVSNTNSLRFKKDEVWDNTTIFKNSNNTLSSEEKVALCYPFIQSYQNTDKVQTQVKSNYETVTSNVIDCDGNKTPLTVFKTTNNLDKVDKRDALGYNFIDGTGRFGYYFQTGNTYDPLQVGDIAIGTYELFGQLPAWARIGQYFSLNNGAYYQVIDIAYVEALQSDVIIIDSVILDEPVILTAIYNVFNWDAFEFELDLGAFQNTEIQVEVLFEDSVFENERYLSEKIATYDSLEDYLTIQATNSDNNEIVYQDGFKHLLRLPYDSLGSANESELTTEKTDQYVYSIDGKSYIKKILVLNHLSTKMEEKVRQMFTLNDITIDGVGYTIDSMDAPERIGITNLYKLTVNMYEVGVKPIGTVVDTNIELDILDVTALILGDDEFVKYE